MTRSLTIISLLSLVSCREPVAIVAPPPPPPPKAAPPQVLDAFSASDRAWVYADARLLRQTGLPDLVQAVSGLRADIQVELSTATVQCGFHPLLAIDEALARFAWGRDERLAAWSLVVRMAEAPERVAFCLRVLAPGAQETIFDGRRAWQLRQGFIVWDDGLFVVGSSALECRATMARMVHPEAAAQQARAAFSGLLFTANLVEPDPFGVGALGIRWAPQPSGSRLEIHASFTGETDARQTEAIVRDSLLQIVGSSASFDPSAQGIAERFVQGAGIHRDGPKVDATFDMPPLAGQTALVSKLTSLTARGVRLHTAWDLTAEARETLYAIAKALVEYANRMHELGRPPRFPPSAPLVPEEIPYGKRVAPNPHAYSHPSWQDIHYSSDHPTFYAYEFVTAKDGRSAVVRARGDIDGDGTTSLFELDVGLDKKGAPLVAPIVRERDPEE